MKFKRPLFDVEISRDIVPEKLAWLERADAGDEATLEGNREYFDLRGVRWQQVAAMIKREDAIIAKIKSSDDPTKFLKQIDEEFWEQGLFSDSEHPLWGLDLGVAAATLAISASRCVPYSSCNAGFFGERHHNERYPLIAFMLRQQMAEIFVSVAGEANAGLFQNDYGSVHVYGRDIYTITKFAKELYYRSKEIDSIELQRPYGKGRTDPTLF